MSEYLKQAVAQINDRYAGRVGTHWEGCAANHIECLARLIKLDLPVDRVYQIRFPYQSEWTDWPELNQAQLAYCKRSGIGVRTRLATEWEVLNEV